MSRVSAKRIEDQKALVSDWASSGLSKLAYSRLHGIRYKTLQNCCRKFYPLQPQTEPSAVGFKELELKDTVAAVGLETVSPVPVIELQLSGNRRLLFYSSVSSDYLKAILY